MFWRLVCGKKINKKFMLRKIINTANPEWLREPASTLEQTLRRRYVLRYIILILFSRILLKWVISSVVFSLLFSSNIVSILLGLLFTILFELFTIRGYYKNKAVPKQLDNVEALKNQLNSFEYIQTKHLANLIQNSVKISSKRMVDIVYAAISVIAWMGLIKISLPIISSAKVSYYDLLIGLKNKHIESNQKLWEVAQIKDQKKRKSMLNKYLIEYGSKIDDLDYAKPTLREQPNVVNKLLEVYSKSESPYFVLNRQKERRIKYTNEIIKGLRIPKSVFLSFLEKVQQNVSIREGRRYYALMPDYYIRKMILELANRIEVGEEMIFKMSWKDIKDKSKKYDT